MADNKRWFKVWASILSDPDFNMASLKERGAWVTLGALVAKHGRDGCVTIKKDYLERVLNVPFDVLEKLSHVGVIITNDDNGSVSVSFKNWHKYQVDTTGYERLKDWRKQQNDNGAKNKKKSKTKNKKKSKYGELKHVLLTDDEYEKLGQRFGDSGKAEWIKTLDEGLDLKDYKYKSHYRAILKWSANTPLPKESLVRENSLSDKELEGLKTKLKGKYTLKNHLQGRFADVGEGTQELYDVKDSMARCNREIEQIEEKLGINS